MITSSEQARRIGQHKKIELTKLERRRLLSNLKRSALDGDMQAAVALGLFELNSNPLSLQKAR